MAFLFNNKAISDFDGKVISAWNNATVASAPITKTFGDKTGTDYAGCIDAWFRDDIPDNNYGSHEDLYVRYPTDPATTGFHTTIAFSGLSNIPATATITAATLYLYIYEIDTDGTYPVSFYRVKQDWVESEVTWNSYKSGSGWATGGAIGATDINTVASASVSIVQTTQPTYSAWEAVTSAGLITDIQNIVNGTNPNYGWMFRLTGGPTGTFIYMHSSDYVTNATLRPYLSVTYTV